MKKLLLLLLVLGQGLFAADEGRHARGILVKPAMSPGLVRYSSNDLPIRFISVSQDLISKSQFLSDVVEIESEEAGAVDLSGVLVATSGNFVNLERIILSDDIKVEAEKLELSKLVGVVDLSDSLLIDSDVHKKLLSALFNKILRLRGAGETIEYELVSEIATNALNKFIDVFSPEYSIAKAKELNLNELIDIIELSDSAVVGFDSCKALNSVLFNKVLETPFEAAKSFLAKNMISDKEIFNFDLLARRFLGQLFVKLWDTDNNISSGVFSSDGSKVVTISTIDNIKVWNANTGELVNTFQDDLGLGQFYEVVVSPNGSRLAATIFFDDTSDVLLWNMIDGVLLKDFRDIHYHEDYIRVVKFSNDNSKLIIGYDSRGSDKAIIWNVETEELLCTLNGHEDSIWSADFNSNGSKIATASGDKTAKIWNAETGELLHSFNGHEDSVGLVKFDSNGSKIVTVSSGTAKIWNAETGELLHSLNGHADGIIVSVDFSRDGSMITTVTKYMLNGVDTVKVWDVEDGELLYSKSSRFGTNYGIHPDMVTVNFKGIKFMEILHNVATIFGYSSSELSNQQILIMSYLIKNKAILSADQKDQLAVYLAEPEINILRLNEVLPAVVEAEVVI